MKSFISVSALITSLATLTGCVTSTQHPRSTEVEEKLSDEFTVSAAPVKVAGVIWLNPLHRRDYPTEWQILWTLGLAKPNENDDVRKKSPDAFSKVKAVASIANGDRGETLFSEYHDQYLHELMKRLHDNYFSDPNYFYNVHGLERKNEWRELSGIRIEYAVPAQNFDAIIEGKKARDFIRKTFAIGSVHRPTLWTKNAPPDLRVTAGGANAGFKSLDAAIQYLQENPDKTAWAMNWDAPSRPLDEQINENLVVLVLAGAKYQTGRKALAWVGRPDMGNVKDFEAKDGESRSAQSWKKTLHAAANNAQIEPGEIGYVIHDANNTHPDSSTRIAAMAQTLTTEIPDLELLKQSFNTPALLGEMRAGSALTNVALAIGYANHFGKHVLVAGTTDPEHPTAVVVSPPAQVRPIDPDKPWFRARSMNDAYLPWWGLRDDAPAYPQGYSK
ncbi:hypothetical protein [Duganella sp. Leaf61]|uniref:hypothetical protein n=1 Tax=Duganella sp. Leaf61 TaxID=1736227 RepID=UPI000A9C2BFC|nr:hypothetical protein [Duganella sp. Leaf61]